MIDVFFWSLWGQLFSEYRYGVWPSPFLDDAYAGLLYRKLEYPGWYSCGFTEPVEIFYLDPYGDP